MTKRPEWKKLIVSILIPLAVGGAAALIANGSFKDFEALNKPPLAPPCVGVPGRVDAAVHPHGHRGLSRVLLRKIPRPHRARAHVLRGAAVYELLLDAHLLQPQVLPCGLHLARAAVGRHRQHGAAVPLHIEARGLADAALSGVGDIRRIPEFGSIYP